MVFAKEAAPRTRADFLEWFDRQMEGEDEGEITSDSPAMQAWQQEMLAVFPDMNDLDDDELEKGKWGEYSTTTAGIYVSFASSQEELAYKTVKALAAKHGVGFFNVSADDGEIIIPADGTDAPVVL